jgi:hypothetical protein
MHQISFTPEPGAPNRVIVQIGAVRQSLTIPELYILCREANAYRDRMTAPPPKEEE